MTLFLEIHPFWGNHASMIVVCFMAIFKSVWPIRVMPIKQLFSKNAFPGGLILLHPIFTACRYNNVPWSDCDPQTWMRTKTVQLIAEEDFG